VENNLKLVAIVKYRQGGVLVYAFYEMLGSMWGSRKTVLKTIPYYDFKIHRSSMGIFYNGYTNIKHIVRDYEDDYSKEVITDESGINKYLMTRELLK